MKTHDGAHVLPGDLVWVIASDGEIVTTTVDYPVTTYCAHNSPIPVKQSFHCYKAAKEYLKQHSQ